MPLAQCIEVKRIFSEICDSSVFVRMNLFVKDVSALTCLHAGNKSDHALSLSLALSLSPGGMRDISEVWKAETSESVGSWPCTK